jgi:hypothetical protein
MTRFRIENDCLVATGDVKTEIVATLDSSPVIAMMLRCGIPLTRENYLSGGGWMSSKRRRHKPRQPSSRSNSCPSSGQRLLSF